MKLLFVTCLAILAYANAQSHPDIGLNIYQLIERYGFEWEEHYATTDDGYILGIQRIPRGRTGASGKGTVFLMHGLACSGVDWVNIGNASLGFILADAGFDVWLGNARGNRHSRNHITLDPDVDNAEFYNFSWDEIGRYDLPAMIDKALEVSGQSQLYYAGHSQGTTSFFVMLSERPEYNDKIKLMQALSPVVFMEHLFSPIPRALAPHYVELEQLLHGLGKYEMPVGDGSFASMCDVGAPLEQFCRSLLQMLCGYDEEQLAPHQPAVLMTNLPAGTSWHTLLHYAQEIVSGHFRRWDYHSAEANQAVYGQDVPPDYNLSNVRAPIALHYGQNDWFAAIVDVHRLRDVISDAVVLDHIIEYTMFNHIDFTWAKDADVLLYGKVLELFLQY